MSLPASVERLFYFFHDPKMRQHHLHQKAGNLQKKYFLKKQTADTFFQRISDHIKPAFVHLKLCTLYGVSGVVIVAKLLIFYADPCSLGD